MNLCRFCSTWTFFEEENEVLTVFTGEYKYICTEDVVIILIHSGTKLEHSKVFSSRFRFRPNHLDIFESAFYEVHHRRK